MLNFVSDCSEPDAVNVFTFARYFHPWRPVVSQKSENIILTQAAGEEGAGRGGMERRRPAACRPSGAISYHIISYHIISYRT
jgi:hypothetical protein